MSKSSNLKSKPKSKSKPSSYKRVKSFQRARKKIKLDPWQIEFKKTKGDKILCCGRQVGKTEICGEDAGDYAVNNPDTQPVVMIAPTERQSRALFSKTLSYLLEEYPDKVVLKGKEKPTNNRIMLKTGVELYCLPVGKDGLGIRFLTIGRLYKDECSRIPEAVHEAVDPALLTTGGDEIQLSTPFGAKGTFFDTFKNKGGAFSSFTRFSITSEKVMSEREICETWTEKQREKALNKLSQSKARWSKRRYAQEFLGKFDEGLHRWFTDKLIYDTCTIKRRSLILHDRSYFMGCDIARMGEDEGTFEIIDRIDEDTLIHVENIITTKKLTNETEANVWRLDKKYDFQKIFIDAGAGTLGVSVFDHLLADDRTREKVVAINNAERPLDREGRKKKKLLKEDLYDNLLALMEQDKIKLLDDESVIDSLMSIQYEYTMTDGEPTKIKIWGDYSHIVEGLIRSAWCVKYKDLNPTIYSISV